MRFVDATVQPWAYYDEFDDYQGAYGIDAVLAAYNSGHGGIDETTGEYTALTR